MINLVQQEYDRKIIDAQNKAARDTSVNKWQSTIEGLATNMRGQQLKLRAANRRYDQVAAQGGSGEYGINDYTKSIQDIRNKIETSKRDIPTNVTANYTAIDTQSIQNQINQKQNELNATNGLIRGPKRFEREAARSAKQASIRSEIEALQESLKQQQAFQQSQLSKASQFNSNQEGIEKQFIDSILNTPLPEAKTKTGIDTRTPQEISMQRDNVKNSTLPAQERAADIPQQYLAKNKLPLQNLTASNLRQANQRVAGTTLGGNTNKI